MHAVNERTEPTGPTAIAGNNRGRLSYRGTCVLRTDKPSNTYSTVVLNFHVYVSYLAHRLQLTRIGLSFSIAHILAYIYDRVR